MEQRHILVVEDDVSVAEVLRTYLAAAGYRVSLQHRGDTAIEFIAQDPPDLILLDLMLPGINGLEVCKIVRRTSDRPIIMTTAKVDEIDRLLGLELGADDYICKPYSHREVVARVKAVLKRGVFTGASAHNAKSIALSLHEEKYQAIYLGRDLALTPAEFRLLLTLYKQPGRIYSRNQLMQHIYEDSRIVTDRTVDTHIKNLRKKMQSIDGSVNPVRSVYGVGYKLEI